MLHVVFRVESANDDLSSLSGARHRSVCSLEFTQVELRGIANCVGIHRVPYIRCNGFSCVSSPLVPPYSFSSCNVTVIPEARISSNHVREEHRSAIAVVYALTRQHVASLAHVPSLFNVDDRQVSDHGPRRQKSRLEQKILIGCLLSLYLFLARSAVRCAIEM